MWYARTISKLCMIFRFSRRTLFQLTRTVRHHRHPIAFFSILFLFSQIGLYLGETAVSADTLPMVPPVSHAASPSEPISNIKKISIEIPKSPVRLIAGYTVPYGVTEYISDGSWILPNRSTASIDHSWIGNFPKKNTNSTGNNALPLIFSSAPEK